MSFKRSKGQTKELGAGIGDIYTIKDLEQNKLKMREREGVNGVLPIGWCEHHLSSNLLFY